MVTVGGSPPASLTSPFRVAKVPLIRLAGELVIIGGLTSVVEKVAVEGAHEVPAELVAAARKK